DLSTGAHVPEADGPVPSAGDEAVAARTEGQAGDRTLVPPEAVQFLAGGSLPQHHRSVASRRGKSAAVPRARPVGRENGAPHGSDIPTCRGIPEREGAFGGRKQLAVGGEG